MKLQDFIDSGYIGKSVDKIKGSSVGIEIRQETKEVIPNSFAEKARQDVSRLTGKKIWSVVKGASACHSFIHWAVENKPKEVINIGEGYYEVPFEDFSIYSQYSAHWLGTEILMDAREVILPPKKTIGYGTERGYVVSVYDSVFNYYFCPYLQYPSSFVPFFKWLVKKKKISIPKGEEPPIIWNKDQVPKDLIEWYHRTIYVTGVPMKNIKTADDLVDYNIWLKTVVVPSLTTMKKADGGKTFGKDWLKHIHCPDNVNFTILSEITQEIVDEYIKETNGITYKVLR